jgi:hypothetical protein
MQVASLARSASRWALRAPGRAARSGSLENERAWNSPRNANVQEKYTGTPTLRADSSFALLRGQESGHERDEGSGQPKQFGGMGRSWLKHGLQGPAILGAGLKMTGPHCAHLPNFALIL